MGISFEEEKKNLIEERKPLIRPQTDSRHGSIVVEVSSEAKTEEEEDSVISEQEEDKACLIGSSKNTDDIESDESSQLQVPSVHIV